MRMGEVGYDVTTVSGSSLWQFKQPYRRLQFQKITLFNLVSKMCGFRGTSTPLSCQRKVEPQQKCHVLMRKVALSKWGPSFIPGANSRPLLSIRWQCHIIILGSQLSEIIVPWAMEALKWNPIYHTFKSRWSCQARLQHWDPFSVSCVVSADVCFLPSARIMQWLPQAAPVHSS